VKLREINDEVFVADGPVVRLDREAIDFVKAHAAANSRKRARICAHASSDDALHEMIIAISDQSYIHPHKHLAKVESFHIVEGAVDVVIFDDAGAVQDVVEMGATGALDSGRCFYYRLADSRYHTLLLRTPWLIVHEVTNGPFRREETLLAPFAPQEGDAAAIPAYLADVAARAAALPSR
jgi:cupin fold WbuC family metalloprotein